MTVTWIADAGDPDLAILIQRRRQGTLAWRSLGGWLETGTLVYLDEGLGAGETYEYRLRAMDATGNRSGFSTVESISLP